MAGLSRTEKYKDLRSRLQDDTGSDLSTKALNPYETRLNQIDANNFAAPDTAMAIASGILEGFGQGDNARAALMTRGLAEMTRYGIAQGARPETFLGLDGVGDLIVTCTSQHSRNFMAGYQIGKDGSAERFMPSRQQPLRRLHYETAESLQVSKTAIVWKSWHGF